MKLTALPFLLIIIVSCSNTSHTNNQPNTSADNAYHINLSTEKSDELCQASSIADTIIYVPLETNEKSIFGNMWLLAMNDSYIVVSDRSRILAFQRDGKFIGRIGNTGKGPGEFISIRDYLLKGDTLFIISTGRYGITKYTVDGKYLGFINQKSPIFSVGEMKNGGYASYDYTYGNLVFFNNNWEVTDTLSIEKNVSINRQIYSPGATDDNYFVKTNNQLLFNNYRSDTIWEIDTKEKKPSIIFNLGRKLLPDHLQVEYTGKSFGEKAKPYQRVNFMQTDSFVFIFQRSWTDITQRKLFFVHNRATNETKQYKRVGIYDDITGDIPLPILFYFNNTLISLIGYDQIIRAAEKATTPKVKEFWQQHLKAAKESDNSMMVILKIK